MDIYKPVDQFYAERSVFITGGTGFMGKVLVEKLMRSCPGIKNIYLLMREKNGQDIASRLQEMINSPLFDKIRNEKEEYLSKIVPIHGDITKENLGISEAETSLLIETVSVVFHSAATVKFDEALKLSVAINMTGTKCLLQLCQRMVNLEALVHVSTAYCNCDLDEVKEEIYVSPRDPERIINTVDWMENELLDEFTRKLIGEKPNTYTFTKYLAETMIMRNKGNLPIVIVRPTIVLSSLNDPIPGWIDNWNGPTGIVGAVAKGLFRSFKCHKNKVADIIPVDYVINLMICAAWRTATYRLSSPVIYNCCTGVLNPITWGEFVNQFLLHIRQYPLSDILWFPGGDIHSVGFINTVYSLLLHTVPAYVIDCAAVLLRKKPIMMNIQKKLSRASQSLQYFTTHEWRFTGNNVNELLTLLSQQDREKFPFDVKMIDWARYVESYVLGIRTFIFKEDSSTLPEARKQLNRMLLAHRACKIMMMLMTWRLLTLHWSPLRLTWFFFLELVSRILNFLSLE